MLNTAFYQHPVILNRQEHAAHKLNKIENYQFSRQLHACPITLNELFTAALEYPIIFAKLGEELHLMTLLGVRANENLLVAANGQWYGRYIPAFIRRYPFLLVETETDTLSLCIDQGCPEFNLTQGHALFEADNSPSALLREAFAFAQEYQRQRYISTQFCQEMHELDLLEEMQADVLLPDGSTHQVQGFYTINEKKLAELSTEKFKELQEKQSLAYIYAHLISLGNLSRLRERLGERVANEARIERKLNQDFAKSLAELS